MLKSIIAVDRNGDTAHILSMTFSIPNSKFDLMRAIRQTAISFCDSANGRLLYGNNNAKLTWLAFCEHVPVQLQKQYGYQLVTYYDMGNDVRTRNLYEDVTQLPH